MSEVEELRGLLRKALMYLENMAHEIQCPDDSDHSDCCPAADAQPIVRAIRRELRGKTLVPGTVESGYREADGSTLSTSGAGMKPPSAEQRPISHHAPARDTDDAGNCCPLAWPHAHVGRRQ